MTFTPSKYQQAIFDWYDAKHGNHLMVVARAGSGKTSTGIELVNRLPIARLPQFAFVAFNRSIADELKVRLPRGANAMTYHSLGLKSILRTYKRAKVDNDKTAIILKPLLGANERWMIPAISKMVSLCKNLLIPNATDAVLYSLALEYDIDLHEDNGASAMGKIFHMTRTVLIKAREITDISDFDDMVWLPNVDDNISMTMYDDLIVDELQDTNNAQLYLILNSVADGGSVIGIGDDRQSIYAFRGANSLAMMQFQQTLNAEQLPLSVSYRCPVKVRELVNTKFPEIDFHTPEWAIEGSVSHTKSDKLSEVVKENDMVLCRVNADLVPVAFDLIRKGIKATIKGRDIGKSLITLIRRQRADDIPDMFVELEKFRERQYSKFVAQDKPHKIMQLDDQIATLDVLSEGANTVNELINRCDTMFSDDRSAVTLSTVHKAKGLESDNVYILRPDLLPHPKAKSPEQKIQESNLAYVAYTRSKNTLTFVNP